MEPPRPRRQRPRARPLSPLLTRLVIEAVAAYWTLLLVRVVLLLVPAWEHGEWLPLVRRVTELTVLWLTWIAPLRVDLVGGVTLAEPVALVVSGAIAAVALAVLAGWQREARWFRRGPRP